jgi:hypothetical protein
MTVIRAVLPKFRDHLARLIEDINKTLEAESAAVSPSPSRSPLSVWDSPLFALKGALESKNMKEIDRLLAELETADADTETRERINAISDKVLMGEYQGALEEIGRIDPALKSG